MFNCYVCSDRLLLLFKQENESSTSLLSCESGGHYCTILLWILCCSERSMPMYILPCIYVWSSHIYYAISLIRTLSVYFPIRPCLRSAYKGEDLKLTDKRLCVTCYPGLQRLFSLTECSWKLHYPNLTPSFQRGKRHIKPLELDPCQQYLLLRSFFEYIPAKLLHT